MIISCLLSLSMLRINEEYIYSIIFIENFRRINSGSWKLNFLNSYKLTDNIIWRNSSTILYGEQNYIKEFINKIMKNIIWRNWSKYIFQNDFYIVVWTDKQNSRNIEKICDGKNLKSSLQLTKILSQINFRPEKIPGRFLKEWFSMKSITTEIGSRHYDYRIRILGIRKEKQNFVEFHTSFQDKIGWK